MENQKSLPLYKQYATTLAIGVVPLNNWGGIEVLDILYGIDDYVVACINNGDGRSAFRKHKIHTSTTSGRDYFTKYGKRYYLDEVERPIRF